jgi:hypothetical protein
VSLFVVDPDAAVQSTYYDPRVAEPGWANWFRLSDTNKINLGTSIAAVSSVPGGVSLFLVDADRAVQSAYYDPRDSVQPRVWRATGASVF